MLFYYIKLKLMLYRNILHLKSHNIGIKSLLLAVLFVYLVIPVKAQEKDYQVPESKLKEKSKSLEKGLSRGETELNIAIKYEDLAKELYKTKDYVKAEEYQKKAVDIYLKYKVKKQLADAQRQLAKIQEAQSKKQEAIQNYDKASKNTDNENISILNNADAERLKNNDIDSKSNSINKKISTLKKQSNTKNNEDIVDAYKQMAEVNIAQNQSNLAIENYNNAISNANNNPEEINSIKSNIADIYANERKLNEAINIKNAIIQNVDSLNNVNEQIKQRQGLAKLLLLNNQEDKAQQLIQEAYNIAIIKGKTIEAKNSLLQLIDYYKAKNDNSKSIELYEEFLKKLESLIKADSSLIDKKIFEETDNKIKLLEKEKTLKDELIAKTNSFNYFLIGALIVLVVLVIIIVRYSFVVRERNKKISLQSLRREMNPHFIFNSLNSVNQFIAQSKEIEANKYLSSYSNLMRNIMENSSKDFISLQKEIEQLQKYLELEHLRFNDKFDFKIHIDENLDSDYLMIPNMLIQPHIENAIWHGLRYKPTKGCLSLSVFKQAKHIEVIIDDDGIGIEKSKQLKTENQKLHQSIGIKNINERINLLNDLYKISIDCEIKEKENHNGTIVTLKFPYINKSAV